MTTKDTLLTTVSHGIQIQHMDLTVDPGVDFNEYCNGTWLKNTQIPAEYPRWGMFMKLRDEALQYLVGLFNRPLHHGIRAGQQCAEDRRPLLHGHERSRHRSRGSHGSSTGTRAHRSRPQHA